MKVQLIRFYPELYASYVSIRSALRPDDVYECWCNGWTPEDIPDDVLWRSLPYCYMVFADDEPVFVFGALPVIPGVHQFWGFGTDKTSRVLPQITQFCKTRFAPDLYLSGVRRVQVHVPLNSSRSLHWLTEHIGMRIETILSDYCVDGSPMAQLVFTRQDYRKYVSLPFSPEAAASSSPGD